MNNRLALVVTMGFLIAGVLTLDAQRGRPVQAPSKFKNIRVLKGMSDAEIQETMKLWGKQVGLDCVDCHDPGDYATDQKDEKKTARLMYQMVQALNQQEFFKTTGRKADCFLCHKGRKYITQQ